MNLLEIYFWNALYWALYLPLSILLRIITEQGDVLGILLIGFLNTIILTIYLAFQDEVLFESWEPAIVHSTPKQAQQPVKPTEVENHATKEKEPSSEREPIDTSRSDAGFSRELVKLRKARVREEFEIKHDEGGEKLE